MYALYVLNDTCTLFLCSSAPCPGTTSRTNNPNTASTHSTTMPTQMQPTKGNIKPSCSAQWIPFTLWALHVAMRMITCATTVSMCVERERERERESSGVGAKWKVGGTGSYCY